MGQGYNIIASLTDFSMKYLGIFKVYTCLSGIKQFDHGYPNVLEIIHRLNLVDYLQVNVDKSWHNFYLTKD